MAATRTTAIDTDRLVLLPLVVDHAEEVAAALSDPGLHTDTRSLRARYERLVAGSPDPTASWHNWVIQLSDESRLVGTARATIAAFGEPRLAEVAWIVGVPWQGRGIAAEAARALVAWLRNRGVSLVIVHIRPEHEASAGVARAAGFAPTGSGTPGEMMWRLGHDVSGTSWNADPE